MVAPPSRIIHGDDVLPALRELLSQHPSAAPSPPEKLAGLLHVLCCLPHRPGIFEVETALEALTLDEELAA